MAVWRYSEASGRWTFGASLGNSTADDLLAALRDLTSTEVPALFHRNRFATQIREAFATPATVRADSLRNNHRRVWPRREPRNNLTRPLTDCDAASTTGSARRKPPTKALPANAALFEEKCQQFARWIDGRGKKRTTKKRRYGWPFGRERTQQNTPVPTVARAKFQPVAVIREPRCESWPNSFVQT